MGDGIRALVGVAIIIAGVAVWQSLGGEDGPRVELAGYYKSDARDRVMAFYSETALSEDEVRVVAERQTHTSGRLSNIIFYSGDAVVPQDRLTFARGLIDALEVTGAPPLDDWDWVAVINPAGVLTVLRGGD